MNIRFIRKKTLFGSEKVQKFIDKAFLVLGYSPTGTFLGEIHKDFPSVDCDFIRRNNLASPLYVDLDEDTEVSVLQKIMPFSDGVLEKNDFVYVAFFRGRRRSRLADELRNIFSLNNLE